jgi:hypothetical protein
MKYVDVVIPVFNNNESLGTLVDEISKFNTQDINIRIILFLVQIYRRSHQSGIIQRLRVGKLLLPRKRKWNLVIGRRNRKRRSNSTPQN